MINEAANVAAPRLPFRSQPAYESAKYGVEAVPYGGANNLAAANSNVANRMKTTAVAVGKYSMHYRAAKRGNGLTRSKKPDEYRECVALPEQ